MFKIFENYKKDKSIFGSFKFFDEREQTQLRNVLTLEQQQMIYMEQVRQYQLQTMMYATMPVQSYGEQTVQETQAQTANKKGFISNNPGFQMNPVSKHKKNSKEQKV